MIQCILYTCVCVHVSDWIEQTHNWNSASDRIPCSSVASATGCIRRYKSLFCITHISTYICLSIEKPLLTHDVGGSWGTCDVRGHIFVRNDGTFLTFRCRSFTTLQILRVYRMSLRKIFVFSSMSIDMYSTLLPNGETFNTRLQHSNF